MRLSTVATLLGSVIAWIIGIIFSAICYGPAVLLLILMVKTAIENRKNSHERRGFPIEPIMKEPPGDPME